MATDPGCCAGPNELLRAIFLGVNELAGSGGGGLAGAVNITALGGTATAVGCGVSTAGTLRVAQATDCVVAVQGSLAHDAVDANNPVKIGGQARTTNPVAVVDADRVNAIFDKLGKQVVVGSIRVLKARQVTTITSSTAETTIVTAVAATFLDLYGLLLTNTSATATEVTVRDATAGGTISSFMVPAGQTVGFMLPESGAWPQGTANNNWTATCTTSVASLKVTALTVQNL